MTKPKFDDYIRADQQVASGKTYNIPEALQQCNDQYRQTRRLYNLVRRARQPRTETLAKTSTKYTEQEWLMSQQLPAREFADYMGVDLQRAKNIRQYLRRLWGDLDTK